MAQTNNGTAGIEEIRALLTRSLGDNRLDDVDPSAPLLRNGIITSIELVSVQLDLERHFGESFLRGSVSPGEISISAIVAAIRGTRPSSSEETTASRNKLSMINRAWFKKPALGLLSAVAFFFIVDRGVALWIRNVIPDAYDEFLEHGRRFYPYDGGLSQDDIQFAFSHHELRTRPRPDRRLLIMLGDSGTIGSYVPAEDALPAQVEATLERSGEHVRVANLAWFGRSLVKDIMMLEMAWNEPIDTVIFTVQGEYFNRQSVNGWNQVLPHIWTNWQLFADFRKRIPESQQAPFIEMEERLRKVDHAKFGELRRAQYRFLEVTHYAPFLQYRVRNAAFGWLGQSAALSRGEERFALKTKTGSTVDEFYEKDLDSVEIEVLKTTIRELRRRGIAVLLYAEPRGPVEWMVQPKTKLTGATIVSDIARETGAILVDLTWALHTKDFTDTASHYTSEANRILGERIAMAVPRKKVDREQ